VTIDIAGVQKVPNAKPAQTTMSARTHARVGHGSTTQTIAEPSSAARSGRNRP
jgi:hypothetical protein